MRFFHLPRRKTQKRPECWKYPLSPLMPEFRDRLGVAQRSFGFLAVHEASEREKRESYPSGTWSQGSRWDHRGLGGWHALRPRLDRPE